VCQYFFPNSVLYFLRNSAEICNWNFPKFGRILQKLKPILKIFRLSLNHRKPLETHVLEHPNVERVWSSMWLYNSFKKFVEFTEIFKISYILNPKCGVLLHVYSSHGGMYFTTPHQLRQSGQISRQSRE
jgi:hypothetical protein